MKKVSAYFFITVCTMVMALSITSCGSGGDNHPLRGTWFGYWWVFGEIEVTFDNQGNMTEFLRDGDPFSGWIDGQAESLGINTYMLTINTDEGPGYGWFLMDVIERHALFTLNLEGTYVPAALEKGAESIPVFGVNDILGTWNGYSFAYSDSIMGMAEESPQSLVATFSLPDNSYSLTMPGGWILLGYLDSFVPQVGYYSGPGTGDWDIRAVMSPDKQFIGVVAEEGDSDDPAFYALNREP